MKRVTILVDHIDETTQDGITCLLDRSGVALFVMADTIVSVEDVPDPLPTEPGTRFWGSLDKTKPCWWFVTTQRGTVGVWYVSQYSVGDGHPSGINSTSVIAVEGRLVRLPDPEATS